MTWSVQGSSSSDLEKWELAQRLTNTALPAEALKFVFTGIIERLEEAANTSFASSTQQKVWDVCSKREISILQQTLLSEFCSRVLSIFSESAIRQMLTEHTRTGSIGLPYSQTLQIAFQNNNAAVKDAVVQQASSMATPEWVAEIVDELKKEGIVFHSTL